MKNEDVKLINRVLDGDDDAFSVLVSKYQKSVHALVWRKIEDFHIAEDITQETFLKAYQELASLKKPQRFSSWLYVIATNHSNTWLRKRRLSTQSIENTSDVQIENATYSEYISSENEKTVAEVQREVVKKILGQLQESDRTVMTLYYLGEMSYEEISEFLGISVSAIKNRLYRARQRLKKEEPMIRKALDHFNITPNLTENIMSEISRTKQVAPTYGKPFIPWAVAASTAVLIALMLGIGTQHSTRFQKPYSLDAQVEMKVELVDTPIVLNLEAKPDVRRQFGNTNTVSKNDTPKQNPDEVLLFTADVEAEDEVAVPKQKWIQVNPVKGTDAGGITVTSDAELYTYSYGKIYKYVPDEDKWEHIFNADSLDTNPRRLAHLKEWQNTLYILLAMKLFASNDDGKTWQILYSFPTEQHLDVFDFLTTEQAFYVIFSDHNVFRSDDNGKTWEIVNNEFPTQLNSLVVAQDIMLAGTRTGLYLKDSDRWQLIDFPVPKNIKERANIEITSTITNKDKIYLTGISNPQWQTGRNWWIFRSTDLGVTWDDITPTNAWSLEGWPPEIKLIAVDETLLAMGRGMVRSIDGGNTWLPPQLPGTTPVMDRSDPTVVMDNNTIYVLSQNDGLSRSIDKGKSWEMVMINPEDTIPIYNLIVYKGNNRTQTISSPLYGLITGEIVKTTDKGKSWKVVQSGTPMTTPDRWNESPTFYRIDKFDGILYAKARGVVDKSNQINLHYISTDDKLMPIEGIPSLDSKKLINLWYKWKTGTLDLTTKSFVEELKNSFLGADQFFLQIAERDQSRLIDRGLSGSFAVSGNTFFMEYNFKLFRCKRDDTEWYDTGVEETGELRYMEAAKAFKREGLLGKEIDDILGTWIQGFKLATSGNTVYVGKRDGHLIGSFDTGINWIDLTPALPFPVRAFKDIVFVGTTVYVATDAGVASTDNGKNWQSITDRTGIPIIIEKLAVDENTLYGSTKDSGVYRLEIGTWKQIISNIPKRVSSLAVAENTVFVSTRDQNMLYYNIEE